MNKRKSVIRWAVVILLIALIVWVLVDNVALELNTITVSSDCLPQEFDGFRIAHVSDLHSAQMGQGNERLLSMLREAKPDIIAITGDLMDAGDKDPAVALAFCQNAVEIAPVYYITGNHEVRLSREVYQQLMDGLRNAGIFILEETEAILTRNDASISVVGHMWGDTDRLDEIPVSCDFSILLSHQPEALPSYSAAGFDLVLTGHAHGGQFRLPFIGGLYAPGQGLLPNYDSGLYRRGDTQMIVSRGIGNSVIPLRFNNPPEVILVILES